jgi:hypothetical protein
MVRRIHKDAVVANVGTPEDLPSIEALRV